MALKKLQLVISANVQSLVTALDRSASAVASFAPKVDVVNKAMTTVATTGGQALGSITALTSAMMKLGDGSQGVGRGVATFGEALRGAVKDAKDLQKHQPALNFLQQQKGQQAGGVNPLVAGAAGGLTARMGSLSPKTLGVVAAAGGVLAGMGEIVEVGAEFEKQMSRVLALTGATASEFEALRKQALALGKGQFGAVEIAVSMGNFAQAGLQVKEIMAAVKPSLDAASAGEMDLASTVTMASGVLRAFGLDASRTQEAMDILVMAANKSNMSVQDMGDALKFVGPIARAAGKPLDEIAATLMALADVNIKGDMGGTTLRNILMKVTNPTQEARALLKTLGLSFQDAAGDALHLGKIIDQTKGKISGFGKGQRLEILGEIGEARAATGLAALMERGGEQIRRNQEMLQGAMGASEQIAVLKLNNVAGSWTQFRKSVDALGISLFELTKGPLRGAIDLLTTALSKLNDLLSGIGDALDRLGPVGGGIKGATKGVIGGGGIGATLGGVAGSVGGFFTAGPAGILPGAKAGAVLGAKVGAALGGVTEGIKGAMSAAKQDRNTPKIAAATKDAAKGVESLTSAAKGLEGSTRAIDVKKLTELHQGLSELGKAMGEQLTSVRELTAATVELNAIRKGDTGFIAKQLKELPSRSGLFNDLLPVKQQIETKTRELKAVEQLSIRADEIKLNLKTLDGLKDVGGVRSFVLPKLPQGRGQFDENPGALRDIMKGIPDASREKWFKGAADIIEQLPERMNRVESIEQVKKAVEVYSKERAAVAEMHKRLTDLMDGFPRELELVKGVMTTEQAVPSRLPHDIAPEAALLGVLQEQVSALQERQRLRDAGAKVPPLVEGIAPAVALEMEAQRLRNLTETLDVAKRKVMEFKRANSGAPSRSGLLGDDAKQREKALADFLKERALSGQMRALGQVGDTGARASELREQLDKLGAAEGGIGATKARIDSLERVRKASEDVIRLEKQANDRPQDLERAKALRDILFLREAERLELQRTMPVFQQITAKQEELQRQVKAGAKESALEGIRKELEGLQAQAPVLLNAELAKRQAEEVGKVWQQTRTPLELFNAEMTRLEALARVPEAIASRVGDLGDQLKRALTVGDLAGIQKARDELESLRQQVKSGTLAPEEFRRASSVARMRFDSSTPNRVLAPGLEEGSGAATSFINNERAIASVTGSGAKQETPAEQEARLAAETNEILKRIEQAIRQGDKGTGKMVPLVEPKGG